MQKNRIQKKEYVLGVIPARLESTRLHGKMLLPLCGKPMIAWTYLHAAKSCLLDVLLVATYDQEIADAVRAVGGRVVLVKERYGSGSELVAAVAAHYSKATIVANIQGDTPVLDVRALDESINLLKKDSSISVATSARPCKNMREARSPDSVKVVLDQHNRALLFSRSLIPYPRKPFSSYLKHIGLYVFRKEFLSVYAKMKQTPLDVTETLEQLRILEHGYRMGVAVGNFVTCSVNTKSDLTHARKILSQQLKKTR